MKIQDLRDEVSDQKIANPLFSFKSKFGLDGKFVRTVMPFNKIDEFQNYLEPIDEHYGERSVTITETDIFIDKFVIRLKELIMVKEVILLIKLLVKT